MTLSIGTIFAVVGLSILVFIGLLILRFIVYCYCSAMAIGKLKYLASKVIVDQMKDKSSELYQKISTKAPENEITPIIQRLITTHMNSHTDFIIPPREFIWYLSRWTINSTIRKKYHQELRDEGIYNL